MELRDLAETIMLRVACWPDDALNELFEAMGQIEERYGIYFELTDEEKALFDKALDEAEETIFTSDEEMRAVFERFGVKPREPKS